MGETGRLPVSVGGDFTVKTDGARAGNRQKTRSLAAPDAESEEAIEQFKQAVLAKLTLAVGKDAASATDRDWFVATTLTLRDRVIYRWLEAERDALARGRKHVYYLSLEFLIGRLLNDVAGNLQMDETVHRAL